MGFYSRAILPRFYDGAMDKPHLAQHRRELLAPARGEVLEIGLGTGLNLPLYPDGVEKIVTVDPNPGMNRKAQRRADGCRLDLDVPALLAEQPFASVEIDEFYMEKTVRTHGYTYRGFAVKKS